MKLGVEAALVDGVFVEGDVEIVDGRIARCGLEGPGGSGIAVPGFVDLQVNGFGGVDFLDADAAGYRRAGEALLETGVTAYQPTLITSPEETLLAALAEVPTEPEYPRILGAHLEGPFLSPRRLGTHVASSRRDPDLALLERLLDGGPVRTMTLAPELPGASARDRAAARARGHGLAGSQRRDRRAGERCVRRWRRDRHASLQRDAAVPAPRPRHRRRRARAGRRDRAADPRRRASRARDRAGHLARGRRTGRASSPTRSRAPVRARASTRSGASTSRCGTAPCAGPTGCSRVAC